MQIRKQVYFALAIFALIGIAFFYNKLIIGVLDKKIDGEMSIEYGPSYKVSFFKKIAADVGLAAALEALNPPAQTGAVPYIAIAQHDDVAQLGAGNAAQARKDFAPDYARMATVAVRTSGRFSELFKDYKFTGNDVILIPEGITLTYDLNTTQKIKAIAVKGTLILSSTQSVALNTETIIVYDTGRFIAQPGAGVTHTVTFTGTIDRAIDPYQMTMGVVTTGGEFTAIGQSRGKQYAKILSASGSSITLESAPSWRAGDEVIIYAASDISMINLDKKRIKIVGVSGATVTLAEPIPFATGKFAVLATRNLVFRSGATGDRAQMMFLANTKMHIDNAAFIDLGRTTTSVTVNVTKSGDTATAGSNQIGRYPIHAHHLTQKFTIENSVVYGDRNETIFYYPSKKRVPVYPGVPLSVYIYTGSDPLGAADPMIWPTSQKVSIVYNLRWPIIKNGVGELPIPPVEATGFKEMPTKILPSGEVQYDNGGFKDASWKRYDVVFKDGYAYGKDVVTGELKKTNIRYINTPIAAMKWGIVNHNSFGDIRNNVVVGAEGSGISAEEGMEFGTIDHNLVVGTGGGTTEDDDLRWWGFGFKKLDLGYGGYGYWLASGVPELINNNADGLFRVAAFQIYHPYDINGAVPSVNNSNQYHFATIPGMPSELSGFFGFTNGVRKNDGNTSYASVGPRFDGAEGNSLSVDNLNAADFEVTDPSIEISNFTGYKEGIRWVNRTTSHPPTFINLNLIGNGKGVGFVNKTGQTIFVKSHIKGFAKAYDLTNWPIHLIDSNFENPPTNISNTVKVISETSSVVSGRISGQLSKYQALAVKTVPNADYVAVLSHDLVKTPIILNDAPATGFAALKLDTSSKSVNLTWKIENAKKSLVSLSLIIDSKDPAIKAVVPQRYFVALQVPIDKLALSGSVKFTNDDIQSGKYYIISKYNDLPRITFEQFVDYLKKGKVLFRLIAQDLPGTEVPYWPESQGYFKSVFKAPAEPPANIIQTPRTMIQVQMTIIIMTIISINQKIPQLLHRPRQIRLHPLRLHHQLIHHLQPLHHLHQ